MGPAWQWWKEKKKEKAGARGRWASAGSAVRASETEGDWAGPTRLGWLGLVAASIFFFDKTLFFLFQNS